MKHNGFWRSQGSYFHSCSACLNSSPSRAHFFMFFFLFWSPLGIHLGAHGLSFWYCFFNTIFELRNVMKTHLKKQLENSSGKNAFMWPHRRPNGCQEEFKIGKKIKKGASWGDLFKHAEKVWKWEPWNQRKTIVFFIEGCAHFAMSTYLPKGSRNATKPSPKMKPKSITSRFKSIMDTTRNHDEN